MDINRITSSAVIGLRNIAWAIVKKDHSNANAQMILTMINLALIMPDNPALIKKVLEESVNDIK